MCTLGLKENLILPVFVVFLSPIMEMGCYTVWLYWQRSSSVIKKNEDSEQIVYELVTLRARKFEVITYFSIDKAHLMYKKKKSCLLNHFLF